MRTSKKLIVALATVAIGATASIPAMAAGRHNGKGGGKGGGGGHSAATLKIKGGSSFKINKFVKDSVHWVPGDVTIASGGTLTIANLSPDPEPHTFSIVDQGKRPRTASQLNECAICGEIAKSHGVNPAEPPSGPPPILTVDPGNDGFNAPGDSQFIGPHQTLHITITAKPGSKLYFMCAIHPWMQGVVKVVK
jgi:hypothetical protein